MAAVTFYGLLNDPLPGDVGPVYALINNAGYGHEGTLEESVRSYLALVTRIIPLTPSSSIEHCQPSRPNTTSVHIPTCVLTGTATAPVLALKGETSLSGARGDAVWGVQRHEDSYLRPMICSALLTVDADFASMPFHKLLDHEQPNARSDNGSRREKRVEDFMQVARSYAHAGIGDGQDDSAPCVVRIVDGYRQLTATRHGVDRVCNEI